MIDTVVLLIPQHEFRVTNYEAFNPTARYLFEQPYYRLSKGYISCVQNPTKKEMQEGNYKPRLTLTKRLSGGVYSVALKIEFSAPKLLFGNNFDELENDDFNAVLTKLHKKLSEMKIIIDIEKLRYAQVTGIHYGKNIVLKNATSSLVINTIRKLDISKRLDTGNTDFRNEGQAIRYHTNSYELTFYDKMKDLEQAKISEKRAIEKDSSIQLNLFTKEEIVKNEVLRMEVRLNNKKKIQDMLIECGCNPKATTFHCLFHKEVAKRVLNHFWDNHITPSFNIVLLAEESTHELFHKAKSLGLKENKALQIIGALQLIKENGIRTLKSILSNQTFYRLKQELDSFEANQNYLYSIFKRVKVDIENMERCKLNDKVV
jgi:hypothetical protein